MPPKKRLRTRLITSSAAAAVQENENQSRETAQQRSQQRSAAVFNNELQNIKTCCNCGVRKEKKHFSVKQVGSNNTCIACLFYSDMKECIGCGAPKDIGEFTGNQLCRGNDRLCKICEKVPNMSDLPPEAEMLLSTVAEEWDPTHNAPQSEECFNAVKACIEYDNATLLLSGVLTHFVRTNNEILRHEDIQPPYSRDTHVVKINSFFKKHFTATRLFRVVQDASKRVLQDDDKVEDMTSHLRGVLDVDASGKVRGGENLSRFTGLKLSSNKVEIAGIDIVAIEEFESAVSYLNDPGTASPTEFSRKNCVSFLVDRSKLDRIIADARANHPEDKGAFFKEIQGKLQTLYCKEVRDDERTYFFHIGVYYHLRLLFSKELISALENSDNELLIELGKDLQYVKTGFSEKGVSSQNKKVSKVETRLAGIPISRIVMALPPGQYSPNTIEQGNLLLHLGGRESARCEWSAGIDVDASVKTNKDTLDAKVIYPHHGTGDVKLSTSCGNENTKQGQLYEVDLLHRDERKALLEVRDTFVEGSNEWKEATILSASKHGKHGLGGTSLDQYISGGYGWAWPHGKWSLRVAETYDDSDKAEKTIHSRLQELAADATTGVVHAGGERHFIPKKSEFDFDECARELEDDVSVSARKEIVRGIDSYEKYYHKYELQQFVDSGIVTIPDIVELWRKGILVLCAKLDEVDDE